jgi:hypothetical protein
MLSVNMIGDGDGLLSRVGCVRCGSFRDRPASGQLPRQQSSHSGTKRRDPEWLVDGGNIGGKRPHSTTPGDVVYLEYGKGRKILPDSGNQFGTGETRHVVIGDDKIEFGFRRARCVQCREAVGYCHDLEAIIGKSPGDKGPNHWLVVDYEDAVGHTGAFTQESK